MRSAGSDVVDALLDGALMLEPALSVVPFELVLGSAVLAPLCVVGSVAGAIHSSQKGKSLSWATFVSGAVVGLGSIVFFATQIGVVDEVPLEEKAQTWVLEEHNVVVPDDLQDELLDQEPVAGTVDGVEVTVRLVDTGLDHGNATVFALMDEATGNVFAGGEDMR